MTNHTSIIVRIAGSANELVLKGRNAWALCKLVLAGERGCTPIDAPAPRWSAYVFNLRKLGLVVETITEPHDGPYAGHHARYCLRSTVEIIEGS